MIKGFEEFQNSGKDTMDAAVASVTAWNKGFQAMTAEVADYTQKSFETSAQVFEKALGAKSPEKALEMQADFTKTAYEGFVGQLNKLGSLYAATAKDAFAPIEKQVKKVA
ncbi:MAG: phasin family protein [Alphaproteobacteria bacterium]